MWVSPWKFWVQSHHRRSSGRSTSRQIGMHMAVLPGQFTRKGQLYATVQIGNAVVEVLVVFSRKRGFQLRVRQRRGIDELLACCPPAAEPPRKQTCNRRTLVFWHNCVSVALSFRQTVHVTKKSPCSQHSSCMCIFPREWHIQRREKGAGKSRSQPLQSRNARARAQTKREVRQEKETAAETSQSQKERKKERVRPGKAGEQSEKCQEKAKINGPSARDSVASRLALALELRRDRTSPWWFWKVCDFDVTGSCDVISPDHFVRGFYYSSFRRCGLNFLVLQKDNKILVHNLSIHEKLEQSTHWNILKKWGKDFTFGSGCTVTDANSFSTFLIFSKNRPWLSLNILAYSDVLVANVMTISTNEAWEGWKTSVSPEVNRSKTRNSEKKERKL